MSRCFNYLLHVLSHPDAKPYVDTKFHMPTSTEVEVSYVFSKGDPDFQLPF